MDHLNLLIFIRSIVTRTFLLESLPRKKPPVNPEKSSGVLNLWQQTSTLRTLINGASCCSLRLLHSSVHIIECKQMKQQKSDGEEI